MGPSCGNEAGLVILPINELRRRYIVRGLGVQIRWLKVKLCYFGSPICGFGRKISDFGGKFGHVKWMSISLLGRNCLAG